jgi:hypothetical protein
MLYEMCTLKTCLESKRITKSENGAGNSALVSTGLT